MIKINNIPLTDYVKLIFAEKGTANLEKFNREREYVYNQYGKHLLKRLR
jgi:hypothetical protein